LQLYKIIFFFFNHSYSTLLWRNIFEVEMLILPITITGRQFRKNSISEQLKYLRRSREKYCINRVYFLLVCIGSAFGVSSGYTGTSVTWHAI